MSSMRLVSDYLVPGEGDGAVISGGAVDVDENGRITAVGSESSLEAPTGEVQRVGGLLMPGLVNGHAHGPMTLLRSAGDGLPLQQWLTQAVWPREGNMSPDDATTGMVLASCEQLLAGVTTSTEMYLFEESLVAAALSTGARMQIMAGIISVVAPDRAALTARLDAIDNVRQLHDDVNSTVTIGYGAHSVYDLGVDRLTRIRERVERRAGIVHVHLEETQAERDQVLADHGRSATQILHDSGLLQGEVVAAHGVWLSDEDMTLLAEAGASVVHCPASNLKLGSGIARVCELQRAGVRVGLGTDGAASNDNLNLWEDMRLAALLARGSAHDPAAMSAAQAFALATTDCAQAIGLPDVGELRPGAWADIVRLDLDHPAFAPMVEDDLFAHLVWAGNAHHVSDVWVAGRQVVADREITSPGLDRQAIQASATAAAKRLVAT